MDEVELSDAVARLLAWVFRRHREPAFLDYLSLTYSETVAELPEFEKLCLAEAEFGDVEKGAIGGIIKQWWLADKDGFRPVPWRELPRLRDDFNEAQATGRMFYRFPIVKFLREGTKITFGVALGPTLACRKVGHVQRSANGVSIVDVRLVWNMKSLGRDAPPPRTPAGLDIDEGRAGRTMH